MIKINGASLSFGNMGLFDTDTEWIHPTVTVGTYELIFVVDGVVNIREEDREYCLNKGELLVLYPNIEHGGTKKVKGHTSFYWLHFHTEDITAFMSEKIYSPDHSKTERVMKDIMQCQLRGEKTLAELILARFMLESDMSVERRDKTAYEISEYIRINASRPLSVSDIAGRFGYNPDHMSRILKSEFGKSAKELISEKRMSYIQSLLINTNDSVKDIALRCGFEDENKFVKFFKYHERITPTQFRNEFFRIHMNSK